jgi:hypothetical protein
VRISLFQATLLAWKSMEWPIAALVDQGDPERVADLAPQDRPGDCPPNSHSSWVTPGATSTTSSDATRVNSWTGPVGCRHPDRIVGCQSSAGSALASICVRRSRRRRRCRPRVPTSSLIHRGRDVHHHPRPPCGRARCTTSVPSTFTSWGISPMFSTSRMSSWPGDLDGGGDDDHLVEGHLHGERLEVRARSLRRRHAGRRSAARGRSRRGRGRAPRRSRRRTRRSTGWFARGGWG